MKLKWQTLAAKLKKHLINMAVSLCVAICRGVDLVHTRVSKTSKLEMTDVPTPMPIDIHNYI